MATIATPASNRPALRPAPVNSGNTAPTKLPPIGGKESNNVTTVPTNRPSVGTKPTPPSAADIAKSVAGNNRVGVPVTTADGKTTLTGKTTPIQVSDKVTAPDVTNLPAGTPALEPVYNASQIKRLETLGEQLENLAAERDEQAKTVKMASVMAGRAKGASAVKSAQATHRREDATLDKLNVKVRDLEKKIAEVKSAGMDKAKAADCKKNDASLTKIKGREEKALAKIEDVYDIYEQHKLTAKEEARRNQIEKAAETAKQAAENGITEFAKLLTVIKDEKLYQDHASFAEYCLGRWGIGKSQGDRVIQYGKVAGHIVKQSALPAPPRDEDGKPILLDKDILPKTESQTRELSRAGTPENQVRVWGKVVARCKRGDLLTAKLITEEVEKFVAAGAEGVSGKVRLKGSTSSEAAGVTPTTGAAIVRSQAALGPIPTSAFVMTLSAEYMGHTFAIQESADRTAYFVSVDDEVISTESNSTDAMVALQEKAKEYEPITEAADPATGDELVPYDVVEDPDNPGIEAEYVLPEDAEIEEETGVTAADLFGDKEETAPAADEDDPDSLFDTSDAEGV